MPPNPDPLIALHLAASELGVMIAEMQGALAGIVVQHSHIRRALAQLETAGIPRAFSDAAWRDFCDRVYAEMLAAHPGAG